MKMAFDKTKMKNQLIFLQVEKLLIEYQECLLHICMRQDPLAYSEFWKLGHTMSDKIDNISQSKGPEYGVMFHDMAASVLRELRDAIRVTNDKPVTKQTMGIYQ
jgi:hypothetical protein